MLTSSLKVNGTRWRELVPGQSEQMFQLEQIERAKQLIPKNMAEACGSRSYLELILQVLMRKPVDGIGGTSHPLELLLPPFCRLVFSSHFSLRKNHFDDLSVGLPHGIGYRPRVDIHRCANVRVPQKFLLNFQVHLQ